MAMTKKDFFSLGFTECVHGLPLPTGTSWQELAKAEGWVAAAAEIRSTKAPDQATEAGQKESEGGSSLKASEPLPASSQTDSIVKLLNESTLHFKNTEVLTGLFTANKLNVAPVRNTALRDAIAQVDSTRSAIVSHIRFLREEAEKITYKNFKRAMRLANKADKLESKHYLFLIG